MFGRDLYEQLTALAYLPAYQKVVETALELDLFSMLTEPQTAGELAQKNHWNARNTEILLNTLFAMGMIQRSGETFRNTEEGERFLTSSGPDTMAGFLLLFMKDNAAIPDMARLIRDGSGPQAGEETLEALDLTPMSTALRRAQEGRRQQEVLEIVRSLPENGTIRRVLDIGCSTGMIGLSVIGDHADRTGKLLDIPPFVPLIKESIRQEGMEGRAEAAGGNFMTDDLGSGWDLILSISVMGFVGKQLKAFIHKIYEALNPGGVLLCIAEGVVKPDFSGPWDAMVGFLPFLFRGMDILTTDGDIEAAAGEAGFLVESAPALLCSGNQQVLILRKPK